MSVTSSGPLVDEQDDQEHSGWFGDRLRDVLQQHRLAVRGGATMRPALPLADGRHQIHHARERFRRRSRASAVCG
jgi:hypothetical protein